MKSIRYPRRQVNLVVRFAANRMPFVKLKRLHIRWLAVVTALAIALCVLYYRAAVPLDTAQSFLKLIHSGQIVDAQAMIVAPDRDKLPKAYWDRIAATEFRDNVGWSMSYTPQSLLQRMVVFWVNVPDGASWQKDSSVQYCAAGRSIIVQNTDFTLTPE